MIDNRGADTCLVTGATGFIGVHVAQRLSAAGYRVRCLVRPSSDTSALEAAELELFSGDLTSPSSLRDAAKGCRYVVHCGAIVSDWGTVREIREVNVGGTRNVLEAAVAAGAERLIHFSTTDVYGHPGTPAVDERHVPARFSNWYSETKREAEAEARAHERDLEVVILRPATVYGPGSDAVVGEMARAMRSRQMLLVDGGSAIAGLTYVANVVDATVLALEREAAPGQTFNVTDGIGVTWRGFLDDIAAALGLRRPRWSVPFGLAYALGSALEHGYRPLRAITGLRTRPLLSRQAVEVLGRDQDFSNRSARELLGWNPAVSYADGLAATIEWLRETVLRS